MNYAVEGESLSLYSVMFFSHHIHSYDSIIVVCKVESKFNYELVHQMVALIGKYAQHPLCRTAEYSAGR